VPAVFLPGSLLDPAAEPIDEAVELEPDYPVVLTGPFELTDEMFVEGGEFEECYEEEWVEDAWYEEEYYDETWIEAEWYEAELYDEQWVEDEWYEYEWVEEQWYDEEWVEEAWYDDGWYEDQWIEDEWVDEPWIGDGWLDENGNLTGPWAEWDWSGEIFDDSVIEGTDAWAEIPDDSWLRGDIDSDDWVWICGDMPCPAGEVTDESLMYAFSLGGIPVDPAPVPVETEVSVATPVIETAVDTADPNADIALPPESDADQFVAPPATDTQDALLDALPPTDSTATPADDDEAATPGSGVAIETDTGEPLEPNSLELTADRALT
jgi:hypothetical protein